MNYALFYHSFSSCWNHGNAHFLRGIVRALLTLGHEVTVYEPEMGWSRQNALKDGGQVALAEAAKLVPGAKIVGYDDVLDVVEGAVTWADVVIVHEWNSPELVAALGAKRMRGGHFILLFHDTHHSAVTAPQEIESLDLEGYDGILAFGEALREIYATRGWGDRAFTWHEAADSALFRPMEADEAETDLIWIGNWGDGERSEEISRFICEPVSRLGIGAKIYGVRYPVEARQTLAVQGIHYGGWLPNHRAPRAFSRARLTVHVPRRAYVEALPGIPTIRVFEALACGIPLICAPWRDEEGLFPSGAYLRAYDSETMQEAMRHILSDRDTANELRKRGIEAIAARHTCAHRAAELTQIVDRLASSNQAEILQSSQPKTTVAV